MSRKNIIEAFQMIDSESMASDVTSLPTNVKNLDKASIRVFWSSADAVGTITIEAKQAKANEPESASAWFELDFGSTISIDMTAPTPDTEHQLLLESLPFTDIRLKYTRTAGTGSISAVLTAKQVGG